MIQKIKHYTKELIFFLLFLTLVTNFMSFYKSTDLNKEPLKILSMKLISDEQYKFPHAKPFIVHFWATWCPTCKLEASNIQRLSSQYEAITIAVKSGSNKDIKKWLDESGYNFKTVNDTNGFIASEFNISAYPTTFIYDKNKNLVFSEVGYTSTLGLYLRMWWAEL